MVDAAQLIEFLAGGSSRCFRILADDGNEWIVRARKVGKNAKRLFNEYVAGNLAIIFGLSRPAISLVSIGPGVLKHLDMNVFDHSCTFGVGTQYIPNLTKVSPPGVSFTSKKFPEANKRHLLSIFGSDYDFKHFYGQRVFSNWVFLEDYKYETLHLSRERLPVFIDMDLAFAGSDWHNLPDAYSFSRMPQYAAYFEGVTGDLSKFEPWFKKLGSMDRDVFNDLIRNVPKEWNVPKDYSLMLNTLLFNNIDQFIREFKYSFELEKL